MTLIYLVVGLVGLVLLGYLFYILFWGDHK
ncbi:potassium-transporting ATPase subunit F [Carnobacterium maltaromaticum]|jgi:uncharacterized membrane protein YuzA (DUF378 family)|nr:potassium-transporting ATPase subunit F [Carnobacterium maltaromaticum]MBC9809602.1 potassium-transporting ATPase subunit F [Carnobacterium maltaromaticum]